ncbi:hypothetical protein [Phyllobacterium sp. K27]
MKVTIVVLSDTSKPCNPYVSAALPVRSTAIDDTGDHASTAQQSDHTEKAFDISLLFLALALFSPLAVPILCYLAWLHFTGSFQQMTVADIWVWVAPLYAMIAALTIVATPVIERGIIRVSRAVSPEKKPE